MRVIEYFLLGAFVLSAFVIVFRDSGNGANNILRGLGEFNRSTFTTLQGR